MDESEKLTALKKAYAEIILNTAKEAAARIMVSERKSLRYQQELSTAKEGALQMLVRLKQMLDSSVSKAEKTSLSQRKKIEELEAQLEEAEDIVKDLREELQQVQDELEKVTNNKLPAVKEQTLDDSNSCQKDMTSEDGLNTTGSMSPFPCSVLEPVPTYKIHSTLRDTPPEDGLNTTESVSPLPCSIPETVSTYEMPSTLNGRYEGNECNDGSVFHMDNGCLHDSDFASIRMRSKEPELYRNGCTQRIRAFERNTFDESLSFSGKDDITSRIIKREDEEAKELQLTQGHISDSMSEDGKKVDIATVALMVCNNIRAPVLKPCRRKRKREVQYNKGKASSIIYLPGMPKDDIKYGIINREDEEANELQLIETHISDNMSEDGKKVDIPRVALMDCSNIRAPVLEPCRRKRKRELKYNKSKASSIIYLPGMQKDDIKSGIIKREEDEEANELQLIEIHISDNMSEDGKKVDIATVALMDCSNIRAPVLKPCRRKRKREVKYNKGKAPSIICLSCMPKVDPYCSDGFSADVIHQSGNISSKINKNGEKDILFSTAGNDALETAAIMGVDAMESDEAFVKPWNALIMTDYKKEVLDKPDLICQDSLSLDSSYGQGCKTDVETVKELPVSPDKKESDLNEEIPIESPSNKLLKYTFRRKRKKEHLNSPDCSISLDECMLDKEIRENQSTPLGSQKSSSMTELPRDNRQLSHVARQLLCFSETKWAE